MKSLNTKLILVLAALSMVAVGCSKGHKVSDEAAVGIEGGVAVTPIDPPAGIGGNTTSNEVTLNVVSVQELNSYVGSYPVNNPSNVRLKVNLSEVHAGRFGGNIQITYTDNGVLHSGNFETCLSSNCVNSKYDSYGTSRDNGKSEAGYNYWFAKAGKQVFSGFFQDNYGAIVLVIDQVVDQGDGQGGKVVGGQIWYRNYAKSFAQPSTLRACWFVYAGPYDCRSNMVINKSALYPTDAYRKLGDFSGLTFTNDN